MNNEIELVKVTKEYAKIDKIFDIQDEAFPINERTTTRNINNFFCIPEFTMFAIEKNNDTIGFISMFDCNDSYFFGLYLAISKQYRNKQYGATTLNILRKTELKGKHFFGCIEALLPESDNYAQRIKRANFYTNNDMYIVDKVFTQEPFGSFQFVSTNAKDTFDILYQKLNKLTKSLYSCNIKNNSVNT